MAAFTKTVDEADQALARLLDGSWRSIAASGWNRYQLHGRGALLASFAMLDGASAGMDYITSSPGAPLPEWLETKINDYDPKLSVVIVFVEDEVFRRASMQAGTEIRADRPGVLSGRALVRVVARTPPPPECSKSLAH
jgi:hypothetical protein